MNNYLGCILQQVKPALFYSYSHVIFSLYETNEIIIIIMLVGREKYIRIKKNYIEKEKIKRF